MRGRTEITASELFAELDKYAGERERRTPILTREALDIINHGRREGYTWETITEFLREKGMTDLCANSLSQRYYRCCELLGEERAVPDAKKARSRATRVKSRHKGGKRNG